MAHQYTGLRDSPSRFGDQDIQYNDRESISPGAQAGFTMGEDLVSDYNVLRGWETNAQAGSTRDEDQVSHYDGPGISPLDARRNSFEEFYDYPKSRSVSEPNSSAMLIRSGETGTHPTHLSHSPGCHWTESARRDMNAGLDSVRFPQPDVPHLGHPHLEHFHYDPHKAPSPYGIQDQMNSLPPADSAKFQADNVFAMLVPESEGHVEQSEYRVQRTFEPQSSRKWWNGQVGASPDMYSPAKPRQQLGQSGGDAYARPRCLIANQDYPSLSVCHNKARPSQTYLPELPTQCSECAYGDVFVGEACDQTLTADPDEPNPEEEPQDIPTREGANDWNDPSGQEQDWEHHATLVCPLCTEEFSGKYGDGNLKRHLGSKHEDVAFPCTVEGCKKIYKRSDALLKHQRQKHACLNLPAPICRKNSGRLKAHSPAERREVADSQYELARHGTFDNRTN